MYEVRVIMLCITFNMTYWANIKQLYLTEMTAGYRYGAVVDGVTLSGMSVVCNYTS